MHPWLPLFMNEIYIFRINYDRKKGGRQLLLMRQRSCPCRTLMARVSTIGHSHSNPPIHLSITFIHGHRGCRHFLNTTKVWGGRGSKKYEGHFFCTNVIYEIRYFISAHTKMIMLKLKHKITKKIPITPTLFDSNS